MKRRIVDNDDTSTQHEQVKRATTPWLRSSPQLFDRSFPYFREPTEIGKFSLNERRHFTHDSSQLRKFSPPKNWEQCSLDLRHGYENMIKRDESKKEYLDDLLRWIMCNKHKFQIAQPKPTAEDISSNRDNVRYSDEEGPQVFNSLNTDFVCWRGLLTRLLCVPYENREDLMLAVVRFRGTYFMCEFDTDSKKQQNLQATPEQEEMCAWGFKFEQYVTADKRSGVPDTESPVNTNMAFCSVARSRLGSHSLVFGAEVDCEDADRKKGNPYIELKTSRVIQSQRQYENFCRFKLIKWWAQSFLIGIPSIVCGFRDDQGVVRSLQSYNVQDIPSTVQSCVKQPWKAAVCFNFLDAFFQFVKSNITADSERCVYVLRWQPGCDLTIQNRGDDPDFHFLPDWFIKWEAWDRPYSSE